MMRSFERRLGKLKALIESIQTGKITVDQLTQMQRKLDDTKDVLDEETGDEEAPQAGKEENQVTEQKVMGGVVAVSLAELITERNRVEQLLELAKRVDANRDESKFEKLREVLEDPENRDEKLIIFTEHRDTLEYLVRRLEGLGFTRQVAQIHGGMEFREREEQIEFFRKSTAEGGALLHGLHRRRGRGYQPSVRLRAVHCFKMPSLAKSPPTCDAFRRSASAMLVTPMVRSKPIVAFRKAAITSGPERLRIRLASSPIVTSRT